MSNSTLTKVAERKDQTIYRVKGLLAFNQLTEATTSSIYANRKPTKRMELWFSQAVFNTLEAINMNLPQATVEHNGKTLRKMSFNSNPNANEEKKIPSNHVMIIDNDGTPVPSSLINTIGNGSEVEVQFIIGPNPNNPAKTLTHLQCLKVIKWVKYDSNKSASDDYNPW
jgi:hypothetical protein